MTRFDPVRPGAGAVFYKAHGLGNDYLVVEEGGAWTADAAAVSRVCHPHEGVGSDGVVVVLAPAEEPFRLRMFNPDGSEFERSGNGLRVVASWLHRTGRVGTGRPFEVEVGGDRIAMTVHGADEGVRDVSVEMGRARTGPEAVGLRGDALEAAGDDDRSCHGRLTLSSPGQGGGRLPVFLVGVGNPHAVVFADAAAAPPGPGELPRAATFDRTTLERVGPALATHPAFAHGTNVQLARAASGPGPDREGDASRPRASGVCDALIWERGVGRTTASGTSACAVAVASVASGRLQPGIVEVRMEGGSLFVDVTAELDVTLRGPVEEVLTGELAPGFLASLG